jgi:hypothetical protein
MDELYEQAGVPLEKRLPLFERNAQVVAMRDDAQNRAIALMVAIGNYDDAIKAMSAKKFALAEGANLNVSEHWVNAHILRERTKLAAHYLRRRLNGGEDSRQPSRNGGAEAAPISR